MNGIPVLMYHALEDEEHPAGFIDKGDQIYVLSVRQFREQMEYLYHNGFQALLFEEMLSLELFPDKIVVITFDDGHESNYTLALPILKEFGFKAEFFITTDWIGKPHYMKPEQIRKLSMEEMSIGSHGVTHAFMDDLPDGDIERELSESKIILTNIIEKPISSMSAPGGRIRDGVAHLAAKNRYRILCTSRSILLYEMTKPIAIVPRFPVRSNDSLADFICIVEKNERFIRNIAIRNSIFSVAKRIIGNRRYVRFRELILGRIN